MTQLYVSVVQDGGPYIAAELDYERSEALLRLHTHEKRSVGYLIARGDFYPSENRYRYFVQFYQDLKAAGEVFTASENPYPWHETTNWLHEPIFDQHIKKFGKLHAVKLPRDLIGKRGIATSPPIPSPLSDHEPLLMNSLWRILFEVATAWEKEAKEHIVEIVELPRKRLPEKKAAEWVVALITYPKGVESNNLLLTARTTLIGGVRVKYPLPLTNPEEVLVICGFREKLIPKAILDRALTELKTFTKNFNNDSLRVFPLG